MTDRNHVKMKATSPVVGMANVLIMIALANRVKEDEGFQLPGGFQRR